MRIRPCGSPPPRIAVHRVERPGWSAILLLDLHNVEAYMRDDFWRSRCPLLAGYKTSSKQIARPGLEERLRRASKGSCKQLEDLSWRVGFRLRQVEDMLCREGEAWHQAEGKVRTNPSDRGERLRELQRRAQATGALEDRAAVISERLRRGLATPDQLVLLSRLGAEDGEAVQAALQRPVSLFKPMNYHHEDGVAETVFYQVLKRDGHESLEDLRGRIELALSLINHLWRLVTRGSESRVVRSQRGPIQIQAPGDYDEMITMGSSFYGDLVHLAGLIREGEFEEEHFVPDEIERRCMDDSYDPPELDEECVEQWADAQGSDMWSFQPSETEVFNDGRGNWVVRGWLDLEFVNEIVVDWCRDFLVGRLRGQA